MLVRLPMGRPSNSWNEVMKEDINSKGLTDLSVKFKKIPSSLIQMNMGTTFQNDDDDHDKGMHM